MCSSWGFANIRLSLLLIINIMLSLATIRNSCCCSAAFVRLSTSSTGGRSSMMMNRLYSSKPQRSADLITSTKSPTVKRIQALLSKSKKRTELGQTVVEGPRMIFDMLTNPKTRALVQQVIVSIDQPNWTNQLLDTYDDLLVCEGTPEVLQKCSDTVTPQGIVACVSIPTPPIVSPTDEPMSLCLILDGVSDPGNVGTLLRSSLACGLSSVILLPGCCDVWNPKALRSAMGSTFLVPILHAESIQELKSKRSFDEIYAATMEESDGSQSIPHFDVPWASQNTGLVIGSEGNGLSEEARQAVSLGEIKAVHVPMEAGIESLNAAVCGSVIMFEYHRQNLQKTS